MFKSILTSCLLATILFTTGHNTACSSEKDALSSNTDTAQKQNNKVEVSEIKTYDVPNFDGSDFYNSFNDDFKKIEKGFSQDDLNEINTQFHIGRKLIEKYGEAEASLFAERTIRKLFSKMLNEFFSLYWSCKKCWDDKEAPNNVYKDPIALSVYSELPSGISSAIIGGSSNNTGTLIKFKLFNSNKYHGTFKISSENSKKFVLLCSKLKSFGLGYRLSKNSKYDEVSFDGINAIRDCIHAFAINEDPTTSFIDCENIKEYIHDLDYCIERSLSTIYPRFICQYLIPYYKNSNSKETFYEYTRVKGIDNPWSEEDSPGKVFSLGEFYEYVDPAIDALLSELKELNSEHDSDDDEQDDDEQDYEEANEESDEERDNSEIDTEMYTVNKKKKLN